MSRYTYHGKVPSHHLTVGWDPARGSFFGQLWPHPTEEDDTPLFVVGDEEIITDLAWLDAQLTPYGNIPQSVQPQLVRDWKQHRHHPRAPELEQFQRRILTLTEAISPRYYILIDPRYGWQTRYLSRLPADEQERRAVYRSLLAGADSPPETVAIQAITDALPAAFAAVQLLVDQLGTVKRRPPTVFIEPDYLLVGPVVVLGPEGLSELQAQQLREVIIVVDDSVRDEVARLFYDHHSPEDSPGEHG